MQQYNHGITPLPLQFVLLIPCPFKKVACPPSRRLEADELFRHLVPLFTARGSPPHFALYNPSLGKFGSANHAARELNEQIMPLTNVSIGNSKPGKTSSSIPRDRSSSRLPILTREQDTHPGVPVVLSPNRDSSSKALVFNAQLLIAQGLNPPLVGICRASSLQLLLGSRLAVGALRAAEDTQGKNRNYPPTATTYSGYDGAPWSCFCSPLVVTSLGCTVNLQPPSK